MLVWPSRSGPSEVSPLFEPVSPQQHRVAAWGVFPAAARQQLCHAPGVAFRFGGQMGCAQASQACLMISGWR